MEQKTIKVRFSEDKRKSYSIQWSELLTSDEVPFESIDQLLPGTEVLAPYHYGSEEDVQYSPATVVSGSKAKGWANMPLSNAPITKVAKNKCM